MILLLLATNTPLTFHSANPPLRILFFFFNDTATTEIYTLSLHDALPISPEVPRSGAVGQAVFDHQAHGQGNDALGDRKSTRLNSSHSQISYAVFCLKKKKKHLPHGNLQL